MCDVADVSRETRTRINRLFAGRQREILRYSTLLATAGVQRGLIGPREVECLWERHIFNCAVIAPAFAKGAEVADLGSGAGLPGLVLALSRPDLRITLIEPLQRRVAFLNEVIEDLSIAGVTVFRARAEDMHGSLQVDSVTARAVAPLHRLAGWALPLCRPGGELVAIKGAAAYEEVMAARPRLLELSTEEPILEQYGEEVVSSPTTVVRIRLSRPGPS